jgi:uncharacterized membrane protein SpoIIM required for sporulation
LRGRQVVFCGVACYILSFLLGLIAPGISMNVFGSEKEVVTRRVDDLKVPKGMVKKIFVNNLGLNAIIISGAFSLMAFSGIILLFNGLQIGYVINGLSKVYGLKFAFLLIGPHLFVELISHILSLYLAYLILVKIIVPLVMNYELINVSKTSLIKMASLLVGIVILTFLGAFVEVNVTPLLI